MAPTANHSADRQAVGLAAILRVIWPLLLIAAGANFLAPAVYRLADPPSRYLVGPATLALEVLLSVGAGWLVVRRKQATLPMAALAGAIVPVASHLVFPTLLWLGKVVAGNAAASGTDSVVFYGMIGAVIVAVPAAACGLLGGSLAARSLRRASS